jgi:hypothetical protein
LNKILFRWAKLISWIFFSSALFHFATMLSIRTQISRMLISKIINHEKEGLLIIIKLPWKQYYYVICLKSVKMESSNYCEEIWWFHILCFNLFCCWLDKSATIIPLMSNTTHDIYESSISLLTCKPVVTKIFNWKES